MVLFVQVCLPVGIFRLWFSKSTDISVEGTDCRLRMAGLIAFFRKSLFFERGSRDEKKRVLFV